MIFKTIYEQEQQNVKAYRNNRFNIFFDKIKNLYNKQYEDIINENRKIKQINNQLASDYNKLLHKNDKKNESIKI